MRHLLWLFGIFSAIQLIASPAAADSDTQGWSALAISGPAQKDSRFLLWFDGHARFRDDISELGVSIIRPGIGWKVDDDLSLWLGYARVTSHLDGPDISENRIWQQATYPITSVFGGKLSGRTRVEQRFRETGDDTGHRVRQFFRWSRPIGESDFSYVVWDELFIPVNDTDWGQRSGFDQNRGFAGIAWKPQSNLRFEAGYLNNYLNGVGAANRINHNVSVALFVSLN